MEESQRIARRKNITVFTNNENSALRDKTAIDAQALLDRRTGAIFTGITSGPHYSISEALYETLEAFFRTNIANKVGPTHSARLYYMWFSTLLQAYNWILHDSSLSGIVDEWNWDIRHTLEETQEKTVWMTQVLLTIAPYFTPTFPTNTLLEKEANYYVWNAEEHASIINHVKTKGHYDEWFVKWNAWYVSRQNDGSVEASVPPSTNELPNLETVLDVDDTVDPATYSHPTKWVPLKVEGYVQKYLTYNWQDVRSAVLTKMDDSNATVAASDYFPWSESERMHEMQEIVNITNNLSNTDKVIAEFWAGGPDTVSPPGMCIWMWKTYLIAKKYNFSADLFLFSGYDLTLHLFETSRITWGLKKLHMQSRPIQDIRRMFRDVDMLHYNGTPIKGASWVPYQEYYFVSPPFADFPSGHSTFSRSFYNVMNDWFGNTISETNPITVYDLDLICPSFTTLSEKGISLVFGTFVFPAHTSNIEANIPSENIVLQWKTWEEMAENAGISRKYGGIHGTSAHTGSVAVSDVLHRFIRSNIHIRI